MKEIIYKCDICIENKDKTELAAILFKIDRKPIYIELSNDLRVIWDRNKHICKSCIESIGKFYTNERFDKLGKEYKQ